jgi:hypothetical protein
LIDTTLYIPRTTTPFILKGEDAFCNSSICLL